MREALLLNFLQMKGRAEVMELIGGRHVMPISVCVLPKLMLLPLRLFVYRAGACGSGAHA